MTSLDTLAMKSIIAAFCVLSAVVGLGQTLPSVFSSADTGIKPFADGDEYMLDSSIVPVSYTLEITPFFKNVSYGKTRPVAVKF